MIAPHPLTIGEIFDRGITLFVRNAPVTVLLAALYFIPDGIFNGNDPTASNLSLASARLLSNAYYNAPASMGFPKFALDAATMLRVGELLVLGPLLSAVLVAALGLAYRGARPSFTESLHTGIKRWWASILVWLATLLSLIVVALVFATVGFVFAKGVALVVAGLGIPPHANAAVLALVIALLTVAVLPCIAVVNAIGGVATCMVVIERKPAGGAVATACSRTIAMMRRAIVVNAAVLAVWAVSGIVTNLIGYQLMQLTKLDALGSALDSAATLAVTGIGWAITIVYYEDQRVRSEGDDLVSAAAAGEASLAAGAA